MLPTKFRFIWPKFSEEKILKNRPIRNKNCLWRPCLLMVRDEMSNLYRGPSIDVSYQSFRSIGFAVSEEKFNGLNWKPCNRIGGVMVSVLASSVVDKIGIWCFSAKYAALRRKNKDWLARNQDNVSEWSDMSIRGLLFQWASTIKIQISALV